MSTNADLVLADLEATTGTPLTATGREALSAMLAAGGRFETGQAVRVMENDGAEIEAEAWFKNAVARFPQFVGQAKNDRPTPSKTTSELSRTERAIATNAARKADRVAEAKALVQQHGNPWKTGNLTHKMFLKNVAPDLAAKMQMEAGK